MTTYSSTINPLLPAMDAPIASAPVRGNFAAAVNDIDFIYGLIAALPVAAGTVTSVAGTNSNGITWSIVNPTTTANITISLGAITPSSVNGITLSGSATPTLAVTGTTSVSGSNTGDQTSVSGNAGTVTTINGHITAGTNVTISGSGTQASPYSIASSGGGGSSAFNSLTSGTNTTAAMVVGSGASLAATGSGTITPTTINGLISASTNITITGSGTVASPYSISASSSAGSAFNAITSGTNTTAAMVVGSGGTLAASGSGTITATAAPVAGITGLGTGVATWLATPTSANLASAVATTSTGSGALVFGTSPAFVTPVLGTPASGTLTNCTFPTLNQNTSGSAASLSVSGQTGLMTVTGLTSTNRIKTVRDAADTLLELGGSYTPTGTWTNLTLVNPALGTPASGVITSCTGSPTLTTVTANVVKQTNNAVTVTSNAGTCSASFYLNTFTNSSAATMAITISTSGAVDGQQMIVRIYDFSAVAQTIGWTNTENSTVAAPTTSNGSTTLPLTVGFQYNSATSKWRTLASA